MSARKPSLEGWVVACPPSPSHAQTDFEGGIDPAEVLYGKPCAYLRAIALRSDPGRGVLMQMVDSAPYRGRRLRLGAWIKADAPEAVADLFARITPPARGLGPITLRTSRATTEWQRAEVVVDVSFAARTLYFGLSLEGPGRAWISGVELEVIERVRPTGEEHLMSSEPFAPINLSFQD